MVFPCHKCGLDFAERYLLTRHLKKATPCAIDLPQIIPNTMCPFCGRTFTQERNKKRHVSTCIVQKNLHKIQRLKKEHEADRIRKLEEENLQMKQELIELKEQVKQLAEKNNAAQSITNIYQSKYVINGDVNINSIYEPNVEFITTSYIKEVLNEHKAMAPLYVSSQIYLDANRPENHSLHITNRTTNHSMVWKDGGWHPLPATQTIYHCAAALDVGFEQVLKFANAIKEQLDHTLINRIRNNRVDETILRAHVDQFMKMVWEWGKHQHISPAVIDESIKRGKVAIFELNEKIRQIENGKEEAD